MGAYSPARVLMPELERQAIDEIIHPTIAAMRAARTPFSGVLYAGLMLTPTGPQLIEYNARFGDPECQVLMARFDGDLLELLYAVATERLSDCPQPRFRDEAAVTVVMAARAIPARPRAAARSAASTRRRRLGRSCSRRVRAQTASWWRPAAGCWR